MKTVTIDELKEKLAAGVPVINVLTSESYDAAHIPGSINIPFDQIEAGFPEKFPEKDAELIVYCASSECQASSKAVEKLAEMGYTNVADYEPGIAGWKEAGEQLEGMGS